MSLFSILTQGKDLLLEQAVRLWFNTTKQRYGNMTNITIDSQKKRISVELDLKGESTPLKADIQNYTLSSQGGKTYIDLGNIVTSREWINLVFAEYMTAEKRKFEVPGAVKMLL